MADDIDETVARHVVTNRRFDIGGNIAEYWMKRCDRAELENKRLVSILNEKFNDSKRFEDFDSVSQIGSRWIAADGGRYGYIVEGADAGSGDLIVRGFEAPPDGDDVPDPDTTTINYFKIQYRYMRSTNGWEPDEEKP